MAIERDRPYVQFNFLVDLGDGVTEGAKAGFQEISGLGAEITMSEYRAGNSKQNHVIKLSSLSKASDVTFKRGVIGATDLFDWLAEIRDGDQNATRNITVQLQSEDHTSVVQTWKLGNARITKYTAGPFNAKGTDVALEELTIGCEFITTE